MSAKKLDDVVDVKVGGDDELVEVARHLRRGGVSAVGIARQRLHHDGVQRGRDVRAQRGRQRDRHLHHLVQDGQLVVRAEQRRQRQQLVQDHARREQIDTAVDLAALDRLGGQIRRLALQRALPGLDPGRVVLGDAEVEELERSGRRQGDVRGGDVPMDHVQQRAIAVPEAVHVVEGAAKLAGEIRSDGQRQRMLVAAQRAQQPPQRRTVDVFEDQEQRTVCSRRRRTPARRSGDGACRGSWLRRRTCG